MIGDRKANDTQGPGDVSIVVKQDSGTATTDHKAGESEEKP